MQEQGELRQGKPVGVWKYYDGDSLGLVMNYDSSRVVYVRPDTARYLVWVDSTWLPKRLNRAPRLLGSRNTAIMALGRTLRYPVEALREQATGYVVLACAVGENGKIARYEVVTAPAPVLGQHVTKCVSDLDLTFLPAIHRGRLASAQVFFVVGFCIGNAPRCAGAPPKMPGSFNEVIVTALGITTNDIRRFNR